MGLFSRKKSKESSIDDRFQELIKVIKDFVEDPRNNSISLSFIGLTKENGAAIIRGNREEIIKSYTDAYHKNKDFKDVIDTVSKENLDSAEKLMKGMKPTLINMPDGSTGIGIDANNLTDSYIDDIISEILKNNSLDDNEPKR